MRLSFLSTLATPVRGLHQAAYVIAGFALGSQLLALVRDRLLAAQFGAGHTLDLYYTAFRIPDFLFATVASLLSLYALLPVLSRLEQSHPVKLLAFLRGALLVFFVAMGAVALVLFAFVPTLVHLIAPGITDPALVPLVRILLLQPIFLGASNILAALTQMRHRFILYSVSPLLYNLGIIFGILVLYPHMGLAGLGWGVVLGALLHALVQLPFFSSEGGDASMPWREVLHEVKEVCILSVPRTLALAAGQISLMAQIALASFFAAGSVSVFMFAYNLQAVPLTIVGVSYSVAAFPTLSRLFASGEKENFVKHIESALRHIALWSILATVFIIVLRAQLVRVILGSGAFDWTATRLTAAALALFVLSLFAQSVSLLIARAYYAVGNTVRPLLYGVTNVVVAVVSSLIGIELFQYSPFFQSFIESLLRVSGVPSTIVLMLAFGYALGSIAQCVLGLHFFARDFTVSMGDLRRLCFEVLSAGIIGSYVSHLLLLVMGSVVGTTTTLGLALQGATAGIAGLCVTTLVLWALGSRELFEAVAALRRRVQPNPIALEPTDIES